MSVAAAFSPVVISLLVMLPAADAVPSFAVSSPAAPGRALTALVRSRPGLSEWATLRESRPVDREIRGGRELEVREDASLLITQRVEHVM